MYVDAGSPSDQSMFITERHCFSDLVSGLSSPCPCGMTRAPWTLEQCVQVRLEGILLYWYINKSSECVTFIEGTYPCSLSMSPMQTPEAYMV